MGVKKGYSGVNTFVRPEKPPKYDLQLNIFWFGKGELYDSSEIASTGSITATLQEKIDTFACNKIQPATTNLSTTT